jgi:hypothetical protein
MAGDTVKDDRAELARLTSERSAMPSFTPATAETVTAAREAVTAAASVRAAECAKRGTQCRSREADEAAARAALSAIADKAATDRAAKLDTDAATVRARLATASPVAAAADPGAAALAGYLATFGLSVPAGLLAQWLVLVGVVALELGSALAIVLVRAASPVSPVRTPRVPLVTAPADTEALSVTDTARRAAAPKASPKRTPAATPTRTPRGQRGSSGKVSGQQVQQRILDTLADSGGRLEGGSVRGLAALIGGKRTAVHSALSALLAGGMVAKAAGGALVLTGA